MYDDSIPDDLFPLFDIYTVGQPHPFAEALPRQQGMMALYTPGGITLHVLLNDCSQADVRAFRHGGAKFGLLPLRGGYAWLMRDDVACWDAPYSPGIEPLENQGLPWRDDQRTPESRATPVVILADERRIVRAMKLVSVSPDLTRKLTNLHARALAEPPASQFAWKAEMQRYFNAYSSPREAFKHAVVTCKGGD
jgi:hypothetical protein